MADKSEQINYGKLLYSYPKCKKTDRVFPAFVFIMLLFFIVFGFVGIYISINNSRMVAAILMSIVIFVGIFVNFKFPKYLGCLGMPRHFYIYENGISGQYLHLDPFSDCTKLDEKIIGKPFFPWNQIFGFNKQGYNDVIVSLHCYVAFEEYNFMTIAYQFPFKTSTGQQLLFDAFKKYNIPEIPKKCPKCGDVDSREFKNKKDIRYCRKCNFKRF